MDLDELQTFLTVAREGSITRAAAVLHLTQPAISSRISRLEDDLGQPLFDRGRAGMALTESGRTFKGYVEEAIERLDDGRAALDQLIGLQRGALSIGGGATATTYLLPSLLGRFHARHPSIRFFVREQPSESTVADVLAGDLDLGVVTLPVKYPGGDATIASKLTIEQWVTDDLRLIVPPGHRLDGRPAFDWAELDGEPLVLFEAGSAVRGIIDQAIDEAAISPDIVMELRSIESIKQMVAQGIGSAFVSQFALPQPDQGMRGAETTMRRRLAVIYRSDRTQNPAARAFLEMMRSSS